MSGTEHDKRLCKHWKQVEHNYYFNCGEKWDNLVVNVENRHILWWVAPTKINLI